MAYYGEVSPSIDIPPTLTSDVVEALLLERSSYKWNTKTLVDQWRKCIANGDYYLVKIVFCNWSDSFSCATHKLLFIGEYLENNKDFSCLFHKSISSYTCFHRLKFWSNLTVQFLIRIKHTNNSLQAKNCSQNILVKDKATEGKCPTLIRRRCCFNY